MIKYLHLWACCGFLLLSTSGLSEEPKRGGTLTISLNADVATLDPAMTSDGESFNVMAQLFEGLVRYHRESTEIEPALATSWTASEDGKKWTFFLRKDVTFHDGSLFNAESVVFSFLRQIDPKHPFFSKDFVYASFTFQNVKTVKALDDHTVEITLDKPYAPFLYNLAMVAAAPIVSPAAFKQGSAHFAKHPSGTGPFRFAGWIPGRHVVLEANPRYWGKPPYLEKLIFEPVKDPSARFQKLRGRQIDVIQGIKPDDVSKLEKLPEVRLVQKPGLNVGFLTLNTEKKPFDQLKVRQAIHHAINKEKLIKLLYQGLAVPAKNMLPPTIWGYNDTIIDYKYNPAKAKQLLKEAGYPNGFETTLWAMPVSRPYMPQPQKIARTLKANLAAIGITAKIVSHDWKIYLEKLSNGEHDMALDGWIGDNGDPDNFLYVLTDQDNTIKPNASNKTFLRNESLHQALLQAQETSDKSKRVALYHRAQEIIHQQAAWIPLAHAQQIAAYRASVRNLIPHPTGVVFFHGVWIQ